VHGVHVLVGIGVLTWIWFRNRKGEFGPQYFTPVDISALYWHLVDLIWIYLFPLLYLID
jgi:cytochrome c oxidase subunit 3